MPPKVDLDTRPVDWVIEGLGLLLLMAMFTITASEFSTLPNEIPTHFNAAGVADNYGERSTVWFLPVIGLVMYVGLSVLQRYPHLYNYPVEVNEENASKLYRLGVELIRSLKVMIILVFLFINLKTIGAGSTSNAELGVYFLPVTLVSFLGLMFFHIWRIRKSAR